MSQKEKEAATEADHVVRYSFKCAGKKYVAGEEVRLEELPPGSLQGILRQGWVEPIETANPLVRPQNAPPKPEGDDAGSDGDTTELEKLGLSKRIIKLLSAANLLTAEQIKEYAQANDGLEKVGLTPNQQGTVHKVLLEAKQQAEGGGEGAGGNGDGGGDDADADKKPDGDSESGSGDEHNEAGGEQNS